MDGLMYRQRLPGDRSAPWRARDFLIDLDLPKGAFLERCMLLTSELVADAIEHGSYDALELRVRLGGERVRVEVSGPAQTPLRSPRASDGDPHDLLRLAIVEQLADAWGVDAGGYPGLWFELLLPRTDAAAGIW